MPMLPFTSLPIRSTSQSLTTSPLFYSAPPLLPFRSWTLCSDTPLITPSPSSLRIPLESNLGHKKALLIGISTSSDPYYPELSGAHLDVKEMRDLLLDRYGYSETDITVLIDDTIPEHPQPTRQNILNAIEELVKDAQAGDHLCFHFSGHSTQMKSEADEADGFDEAIVPLDCDGAANMITDSELHGALVAPLPSGANLVAVFDTCHSGSLLDSKHYRSNRVHVPWISRGKHQLERNDACLVSPYRAQASPSTSTSMLARRSEILMNVRSGKRGAPPICSLEDFRDCNPNNDGGEVADILSLASCKDSQVIWEENGGKSMTACLVDILRRNPSQSLEEVLTQLSRPMHIKMLVLQVAGYDGPTQQRSKRTLIPSSLRFSFAYLRHLVDQRQGNKNVYNVARVRRVEMARPWRM